MTASSRSPTTRPAARRARGFTLVELAVVLAIVGMLLGGLMYTLSAQTEARTFGDTQRRLEDARDLLIAFAIVNGRLPCPAIATSEGDESFAIGSAGAGGGTCSSPLNGFLPARAIGFRQVDSQGFALDAWGNRLRYAVAQTAANPSGSTGCSSPASPAFTHTSNTKANGVACAPQNIVICSATSNTNSAVTPPSCGTWASEGQARPVTNQLTVAALVFSTGKNTIPATGGADEAENTDNDGVFVWHEPRPTGATGGEFDDQMVWLPASLLYQRLISAGVLP